RRKRTGSDGASHNRADFPRMPHAKLQRCVPTLAESNDVRAFDREPPHDSSDVIHRELPAVQSGFVRNVAWWIAASIVCDAAVCARKIADLRLPLSDVVSEFMCENDWVTITIFLKVKLRSTSIDI